MFHAWPVGIRLLYQLFWVFVLPHFEGISPKEIVEEIKFSISYFIAFGLDFDF